MAHELEVINGKASMFSVKQMPWHKLGTIVEDAPTAEEAIKLANMDWEVGLRPLFNEHGEKSTHQETFRVTDGKTLGTVGPSYTVLQNKKSFDFFDPFIENGLAKYETGGVLRDGTRTWVLASLNIPNGIIVPQADDEVKPYVLLFNSHDDTLSPGAGFTTTRVVCANTLAIAIDKKGKRRNKNHIIRFKHTKNVEQNLESIRETMNVIKGKFEATVDQYKLLTTRQVNQDDIKRYVKVVFSLEKDIQEIHNFEDSESQGRSRVLPQIVELFESGRGNNLPGVNGTLWALYNATTEYLTHYRGRSDESRLESMWFSTGADLNRRALETALELV